MELVKLDFPDRDLYILKDGDWRGYRSSACAKEPETVEWIRSFEESSHFWDVGASVGPYSLIAAALGNVVWAFEPFAPSFGQLQQNVWMNLPRDTIYPVYAALGDHQRNFIPVTVSGLEAGSASHPLSEEWRNVPTVVATSSSFNDEHVALRQAGIMQYFSFWPADALTERFGRPDHVKIDVDGGELGVIEGGRETWKHVQSIMVESEPPTIDSITVILQAAGLELVDSWQRMGNTKQRNYLYRRA